jgi:hypothetical protein
MPLEMFQPRDKFLLNRGVVGRQPVIGHLRDVLKSFASKPEYTRFYIGITSDLDRRLAEHRGRAMQFRWMCPIYEEPESHMDDNSFDLLEREALMTFRGGIVHPQTGKMALKYENLQQGSPPKRCLYILVG